MLAVACIMNAHDISTGASASKCLPALPFFFSAIWWCTYTFSFTWTHLVSIEHTPIRHGMVYLTPIDRRAPFYSTTKDEHYYYYSIYLLACIMTGTSYYRPIVRLPKSNRSSMRPNSIRRESLLQIPSSNSSLDTLVSSTLRFSGLGGTITEETLGSLLQAYDPTE